jgi:hypothetical protein
MEEELLRGLERVEERCVCTPAASALLHRRCRAYIAVAVAPQRCRMTGIEHIGI